MTFWYKVLNYVKYSLDIGRFPSFHFVSDKFGCVLRVNIQKYIRKRFRSV